MLSARVTGPYGANIRCSHAGKNQYNTLAFGMLREGLQRPPINRLFPTFFLTVSISMSEQDMPSRMHGLRATILLAIGVLAPLSSQGRGEEHKIVAKMSAIPGAVLHRQGPQKAWRIIKPGEAIVSEDLLVAFPGGPIDSGNAAVRMTLLSDLARVSQYPILESAVILHENPDVDLDFTLDRGRVDLTNRKAEGAAHVRVRFRKEIWDITLDEPKTRVALELYGRWPQGVPFSKDVGKSSEEPTADLVLLVLAGDATLKANGNRYALRAPPGPASFHWDSVVGSDAAPQRLEEAPGWARPAAVLMPRSLKDVTAVLRVVQQRLVEDATIQSVLAESLDSDNPSARRIAIYGLAALDDIGHLADALTNAKYEDVRDAAVPALRAWIGRAPGQDLQLYNLLIKDKNYTANQAEIVLQLLHSFGETDLARPATYETLIDYLMHDKPAVRQLAIWHLRRLVPAGREVTYNPTASEEDRQRTYEKWKQLVPSGKMPPAPGKPKP